MRFKIGNKKIDATTQEGIYLQTAYLKEDL